MITVLLGKNVSFIDSHLTLLEMADAEEAKTELTACEKEISRIRASLRALTSISHGGEATSDSENDGPVSSPSGDLNALEVAWMKTEGLPSELSPELKLQLSSPVEEITLTKLYDPLDDADNVSAVAVFRGVETGQATLLVTAYDKTENIVLGTSTLYDVAQLTKFDALHTKQHYETELKVEIQTEQPTMESKPEEDNGSNEPTETETSPPVSDKSLVCSIMLKVTYTPSNKDRREELYELLNKATQRKAAAVEKLRRAAMEAARSSAGETNQSSSAGGADSRSLTTTAPSSMVAKPTTRPGQAVKSGFLNKTKKETKTSRLNAFYERTIGPNSLIRKILPVAKNYIIFCAFVGFMHFKGHLLALPPPV